MRRVLVVLSLGIVAMGVAGCGVNPPVTLSAAVARPDRRYALQTASGTLVVDSLHLVNDSVVAYRAPIRTDLSGEEVRLAAAEVRSIKVVHPDRAGLGLTAIAIAPLLIFGLVFTLGYGSD